MFLFQEKHVNRAEIGLTENEVSSDIVKMSDHRLQTLANYVIQAIEPHLAGLDPTPIICKYIGGKEISIPASYLMYRGHDLETLLKNTFPSLNKYHRDGDLKKEILRRIFDDFPDFIPACFLNTFKNLQKPFERN
jgi:hypothetical protein